MVSVRSASISLLLLAFKTVPAPAAVTTIVPATLSGIVRDDAGRMLEGAEVLVLSAEGSGNAAALRAVTDAGGHFLIGAITPGVYRVAAIKTGYIAALGRVNTLLRSSIDLVLRPIPQEGQPGAEKVLDDLSWALRLPKRSVMREIDARDLLVPLETGGARAFAARVEDSVRGEVDHVVAIGSWRPGASGSSNLEGNETHMRVAGTLGERGAIQILGRRGSLDSSSPSSQSAVSRGASDVDLDVSYDTSVDGSLAMRAFYSAGDLEVGDGPGTVGPKGRQSQRSWGYDARWRQQVDASSRVAVRVGYHDASLDLGQVAPIGWDAAQGDASDRAIGAEGSYENLVGDGHLVRLGVRAQLLSLSEPSARVGRTNGMLALEGTTGWSLLVDSEDHWSIAGPFAVTYGLAARQDFDGPGTTALTPRVGGSWTAGRMEARAEASYLLGGATSHSAPLGYDVELKTRLDGSVSIRGTASYIPSRANDWGEHHPAMDLGALYVTDGFTSDRFVAVDLERVAPSATVSFGVARGRAEGALAPALDDVPVVLLTDHAMDYDAARLGVKAPRAGSSVSLEYRAIKEYASQADPALSDAFNTLQLDFAQELVRFAGGRAACRFLMTARSAVGRGPRESTADLADARHFVAEHQRIGAGLSLAF
jgi:hypothetical protein